jgi:hypothetical protein
MSFFYRLTWQKIRVWLLGLFILLFVTGFFILMHTGQPVAPMTEDVPVANGEDFGQFLIDHYALLSPFFDRHRPDLITQGEPLLIRALGDVILLNMAIGWVVAAAMAFGFSHFYARSHAKPWESVIYSTWRIGLEMIVFLMGSFGVFGWEQTDLPIPLAVIIILFVLVDIIAQSVLVSNIYGTGPTISTVFYICVLLVLVPIGALLTGAQIKKKMSILLSQFADVPAVTTDLLSATATGNGQLNIAHRARDDASEAVTQAQAKLDQIRAEEDAVQKSIEAKKNSEAYVFGRIVRIRASGDLLSARDQMTAFLTQFPNGTLVAMAKAQLDMINQDLAQEKQGEAEAAHAAAQARADLQARAAQGMVTLEEMRHALLGKSREDVTGLFGQPSDTGPDRWDYRQRMLLNAQAHEKHGLTIHFSQDAVQGVEYYSGN